MLCKAEPLEYFLNIEFVTLCGGKVSKQAQEEKGNYLGQVYGRGGGTAGLELGGHPG